MLPGELLCRFLRFTMFLFLPFLFRPVVTSTMPTVPASVVAAAPASVVSVMPLVSLPVGVGIALCR